MSKLIDYERVNLNEYAVSAPKLYLENGNIDIKGVTKKVINLSDFIMDIIRL